MRVDYFRCYWPSNLVFVVRCDLHSKFDKDRTKTAVPIVDDRYFGQTDRQTLKWFSICPLSCIALDRQQFYFTCNHGFVHRSKIVDKKVVPYPINECWVRSWSRSLGSQPAGDISHKPGGRLPLLSSRPLVTFPAEKHHCLLADTNIFCLAAEAGRYK